MDPTPTSPLDLHDEYLVLEGTNAVRLDGGPTFWQRLASGDESVEVARRGWLVAAFTYDGDWQQWEVHPAGDEVVHVVAGEVDLVLDLPSGPERIELRAGRTVVVPRGVWHTAVVRRPGAAIHVTFGEGTRHRPLDEGPDLP